MNISINNVASGGSAAVTGARGRGDRHNMAAVMEPVAKALGMTTDELRTAQRSGQSLNDIATAKGVSHADLIAAIKSGLGSVKGAGGASAPQGQDLDAVAERMASRVHGKGGGRNDHDGDDGPSGGAPAGPPPASAAATNLSSALGMSTTELFKQLDSGADLYGLAQTKGVSSKAVNDLIAAGLRVDQQL